MKPDEAVSAKARRQHGLITRAQAREAGFSDDAIDWRLKNGIWQPEQRGVICLPGTLETPRKTVMGGCLAIPGATASYRAAADLWEIPDVPIRPEVTIVKYSSVKLNGVEMHRAEKLEWRDRVWRDRIPVTSLPRTVVDLSSVLRPEETEAVVVHLAAKRRLSLETLRSCLADLGTQGRRGAGTLKDILIEQQGRDRHIDSAAQRRLEKLVTAAWKRGLLPQPYFEYPVRLANGKWRFPDIGYPWHTTGFELVSFEHHANLAAFAADLDRNLLLLDVDWLLVPVTDLHVRREPERLVELMAKILARREVRKLSRAPHG